MTLISRAIQLLVCTALCGCGAAWQTPGNPHDVNGSQVYMAQREEMPGTIREGTQQATRRNASRCAPVAAPIQVLGQMAPLAELMPLSPGDLVRISVPGDDAPTGSYKVDSDGTLALDAVGRLPVAGRSVSQIEIDLAKKLISLGHFRPGFARVTVRLLDRGAVRVTVSGAVFQPGQVVINQRSPQDTDVARETATGDHATGRSLSVALANAAGVRPDADIRRIVVVHSGTTQTVDLTGLLDGHPANDILLVDGDHVEVTSRHCFQEQLARPSPITPPGVRVFLSNLTTPASSNAQAAVGHDQTSLPYGTRFLQALVSANCVGGTQSTNADRRAVLISVNPASGESEVIERRVEALVRRTDRDDFNPVVLPGDAIACYDSPVTNLRDVAKAIGDITLLSTLTRAVLP
jgi:polysaccharide export outer membrane protein